MSSPLPSVCDPLFALLIEQVRDHAIFAVDDEGQISGWNTSLKRLFGIENEQALPKLAALLVDAEHAGLDDLLHVARSRGRCERLMQFKALNGKLFRGYVVALFAAGQPLVVSVRDLSLVSGISAEMESADSDSLTQLASRDQIFTLGRVEYKRWKRYLLPFSVVLLELDQFADIQAENEEKARAILYDTADVLRQCVREVDVIARLHGGVFAALLFNTPIEGASTLAERIRKAVARVTFLPDSDKKRLSVSLIATTAQDESSDFDHMMTNTAAALSDLRREGGDRLKLL
jgi:diguanylate cyclase (GGDEF)-like protein